MSYLLSVPQFYGDRPRSSAPARLRNVAGTRRSILKSLVISEIAKGALNRGIRPELHFFRDSHGNEVDLLIKKKSELLPVEIKSAETLTSTLGWYTADDNSRFKVAIHPALR